MTRYDLTLVDGKFQIERIKERVFLRLVDWEIVAIDEDDYHYGSTVETIRLETRAALRTHQLT